MTFLLLKFQNFQYFSCSYNKVELLLSCNTIKVANVSDIQLSAIYPVCFQGNSFEHGLISFEIGYVIFNAFVYPRLVNLCYFNSWCSGTIVKLTESRNILKYYVYLSTAFVVR